MEHLPDLPASGLGLLLAPQPLRRTLMTALATQLARRGPLRVLDGGNCFDARGLARRLRAHGRSYHAALDNVQVARAFTCFQLAALLAETAAAGPPTLLLDLLGTFGDEHVPANERQQAFHHCLAELHRLGQHGLVLASAGRPPDPERRAWLAQLESRAAQVWQFELPAPPTPLRLF